MSGIGASQTVRAQSTANVMNWLAEEQSAPGCQFNSHDARVVCLLFGWLALPNAAGIYEATDPRVDRFARINWSAGDAGLLTADVDLLNGMFVSMPATSVNVEIVYALPTATAVGPDIRASVILGRGSKGPPFQARRTIYVGDLVGGESAPIIVPKHAHSVFFSSATYGTPLARVKQLSSDLQVINDSDVGKTISSAAPLSQTTHAITITGTGTLVKAVFMLGL